VRQVPTLARFAALYTALYCAFGTVSPFLPQYLSDRGLAAQQIAALMSLGTAVRLLSGPVAGRVSDLRRAWRLTLFACAGGAGLVALLYLPAYGFLALLLVSLAHAALLAPLAPVADAMAVSAAGVGSGRKFEYGWVRGIGSGAFIAGSIAAGYAAQALGLGVIFWLSALLLAAAAISALPLPDIAPQSPSRPSAEQAGSIGVLLAIPAYRRLLLVGALVLGSHTLHDTFAVIDWRAAGIGTGTAGLLWSEQVAAEVIVFFLIGPPLLRYLGAARAAALAAAAGVLRWTVMGASTDVVLLALVEPLHGFTFALLHLAGMRVIAQTVPLGLAATAQAVYGTLALGLANSLLTLASGFIYAALQGRGFWIMALLCAAAIPLARGLSSCSAHTTPKAPGRAERSASR
jgi:PPP family 3-phenylpropionic acid transporter